MSPNESKVRARWPSRLTLQEPVFSSLGDRRGAIVNLQLAEYLVQVPLGRAYRNTQLVGDFLIGEAVR